MEQMVSIYRVLILIHLPRVKRKFKDMSGEGHGEAGLAVHAFVYCPYTISFLLSIDIKCHYVCILLIYLTHFSYISEYPIKNNNK